MIKTKDNSERKKGSDTLWSEKGRQLFSKYGLEKEVKRPIKYFIIITNNVSTGRVCCAKAQRDVLVGAKNVKRRIPSDPVG
jgi:hypothetical protein